jgi:hypothetical protein
MKVGKKHSLSAPIIADGGDQRDSHRQAAAALLREVISFSVPAEEISGERLPESRCRERVNVFTPRPEVFLFSVSESYASWLVKSQMATVLRTTKRFRGIAIIPEAHVAAMIENTKYRPSAGRRVLGYAHKEYSELFPAGVWTLDRLPEWARALFLPVIAEATEPSSRGSVRKRSRAKVIQMPARTVPVEMPRRDWRAALAGRLAA